MGPQFVHGMLTVGRQSFGPILLILKWNYPVVINTDENGKLDYLTMES